MSLNVNGVSNVKFSAWENDTYFKVLTNIRNAAQKRHVDYTKTPVYDAFINLHENTDGSELVVDKFGRISDKNGVIGFFPYSNIKSNALLRNIILANNHIEENNYAANETEAIGLDVAD